MIYSNILNNFQARNYLLGKRKSLTLPVDVFFFLSDRNSAEAVSDAWRCGGGYDKKCEKVIQKRYLKKLEKNVKTGTDARAA